MSERPTAVRHEALPPGRGPAMSAFALALRRGTGDALRFLEAPPQDDEGWAAQIEKTAPAAPAMPAALIERLVARQAALGAGSRAEANARALGEGALAVVTGQQPGLLGGPLLTFHKAAGALALARRLDGLAGRRVVPVFWLASEDHDLDEANRAVVIDRQGQARGLRLPMEADGRSLMDRRLADGDVEAFEAVLRATLPDTERGAEACALVQHVPGEDLATWCVRTLLAVFGDAGLVVLEPPLLAPEVGATHAWLLDHAAPIQAAIADCGRELEVAGLPAPLAPVPGTTTLFYRQQEGGPRLRVGLDEAGDVMLRGEAAGLDRAALRAAMISHPLRSSGNVAGRVFVQNRHLPVLAYIAGPTEIAYQAQLRAAHEALGCFFPLALPRPRGTWIDAKSDALLEAFGLSAADVLSGETAAPASEDDELETTLAGLTERLEALDVEAAAALARGGRGADALRRALTRTRETWAKAGKSVRAAFEADAGVGRARWTRLENLLRPHGRAQERLLSPLSLVARHGLEAVRAGLASFDPLQPVHHVLHLGNGAAEETGRSSSKPEA